MVPTPHRKVRKQGKSCLLAFRCFWGHLKNHDFVYILPREKRGFQRLKPTISHRTYNYCSEKRTAILRPIKPLSSLDIIFFANKTRGEAQEPKQRLHL